MDQSTEYGGRTLKENPDYSITISMSRYLADKARPINLNRSRLNEMDADASEITAMRGITGKLNLLSSLSPRLPDPDT